MIRINLLPVRAAQKKERLRSQATILALSVLGMIAVCVMLWMSLSAKVDAVTAEIAVKNAEIARLKTTIGEVDKIKLKREALRAKLNVLSELQEGRSGPVRLLDALSSAMPEKVWITSFVEENRAVSISGGGLTEETVADFLRRLEESEYYENVELIVLEQKTSGGRDLQNFSIRCVVEKRVKKQ